jgi:hypothetical protein
LELSLSLPIAGPGAVGPLLTAAPQLASAYLQPSSLIFENLALRAGFATKGALR